MIKLKCDRESNLVKRYRKIPSTRFLYEISEDGIVRNTKSKKIRRYVNNKEKLVEEVWNKQVPMKIIVNGKEFESKWKACEYIKEKTKRSTSIKTLYNRMLQKRKRILGLTVEYL